MKKISILLAVFATFAVVSCVNEEQFNNLDNGQSLSEKDLAFYLGSHKTRSAVAVESTGEATGVKLSLGKDGSGHEYYLEESVVNLNSKMATRGTPIYNENITSVEGYDKLDVVTYLKGGGAYTDGNATYGYKKQETVPDDLDNDTDHGEGAVYFHRYDNDIPWPEDPDKDLYFFLKMPTEYLNNNSSNYTYDSTNGKIEFDYTSPLTGETQKDILFSSRTLNKTEYKNNYTKTGAPVTMYHALTGVKFRVGNNNSHETKTIIREVKISGLYNVGHSVVDPANGTATWTPDTDEETATFTLGFDDATYSKEADKDNSINYTSGDNNTFGDSWYSAANTKNLNDANGTKTFWFIPQEIPDNAVLTVTFCVKTPDTSGSTGGGMITHTIKNFGEKIRKGDDQVFWGAGELRTYTLEPEEVDVEIFDTMEDLTKSGLHVTNTGNVDEYVRMLVIGNWYGWESEEDMNSGKEPDILVGYLTDGSAGPLDTAMVRPWFREDAVYGQYFDDTFKGGKPDPTLNPKWVKAKGGFYYTEKIGPGQEMDEESTSGTVPLFQSYDLPEDKIPTIYIPVAGSNVRVPATGVHLIMEVVIQAIGVPKDSDGNEVGWQQAWYDATGIPGLNPNPTT